MQQNKTVDQKDSICYNIGIVTNKEQQVILANELAKYTTLNRLDLAHILARSGYTGMSFESVEFLGLTNSGDFCYSATYFDDAGTGEVETVKIYVSKSATGDMTAEF